MTFLIGQNPRQDENRPYEYVPVRHVPLAPTSFEYYMDNALPDFDALPTWAYATPHNIQRNTPQNESCEACHGNADIFLTADKVKPEELAANQAVIVESPPPALGQMPSGGEGEESEGEGGEGESQDGGFGLMLPDNHANLPVCLVCHYEAIGDIPDLPENHGEYKDDQCTQCHQQPVIETEPEPTPEAAP